MRNWTKLFGTLALAAAMAAPAAQAGRPDDRAGLRGPGGVSTGRDASVRPDDRAGLRGPAAATSPEVIATASRPDDRAGSRGPGAVDSTPTSVHPDDRSGARGPGAVATYAAQPTSTEFDWSDALIGGLAGMGTALLFTGGLLVLVSRRGTNRRYA